MEGLAWFGTPTQPTAMDEAVDRATDELLIAPDWAIIMEICDEITQSSAAVDACRAIRRRMTHKNPKVALLALTLLEAGMKNCTEPFHAQVASKSFQADLVKVATGKGEAAERALSLVESFADAFQAQGYPQFGATYNSLVKKGVTFPQRDVGAAVPLFTPPPSAQGEAQHPHVSSPTESDAQQRDRPVFANGLDEAEDEQEADKAFTHKWTMGFMPGYSQLATEDPTEAQGSAKQQGGSEPRMPDPFAAFRRKGSSDSGEPPARSPTGSAPTPPSAGQGYPGATIGAAAGRSPTGDGAQPPRAHATAVPRAGAASGVPPELPLDPSSSAERLRTELGAIGNNVAVLRECLESIEPSEGGELDSNELVQELLGALRAMEPRVVALIEGGTVEDEGLVAELFGAHEQLQTAFELYDEKLAHMLAEDEAPPRELDEGDEGGARAGAAAADGTAAAAGDGGGGFDLLGMLDPMPAGSAQPPPAARGSTLDELSAVFAASSVQPPVAAQPAATAGSAAQAQWGAAAPTSPTGLASTAAAGASAGPSAAACAGGSGSNPFDAPISSGTPADLAPPAPAGLPPPPPLPSSSPASGGPNDPSLGDAMPPPPTMAPPPPPVASASPQEPPAAPPAQQQPSDFNPFG